MAALQRTARDAVRHRVPRNVWPVLRMAGNIRSRDPRQ
jgi:hypothetical protein